MKHNKKVKLCQYCQVEISKRSKLCPNCKKKQKNSIIQLFWIVTGSIFVLLCLLSSPVEENNTKNEISTTSVENISVDLINTESSSAIDEVETTIIKTELTEDEYKAQCQEMYYDDVFFEDNLTSGDYVKLHLMISESYYFEMENIYSSSFSELMDKWSLYRDFYRCSVLRENEDSYVGVGKIDLYFSSNYELTPNKYDLGNKIVIYGEVISFSNNTVNGYNDVVIIPKYIEMEE